MGTVRVQGLGEVEIAGDTITAEEAKNILSILQEKKSERSKDKPPIPLANGEDPSVIKDILTQSVGGVRDATQSILNLTVRPINYLKGKVLTTDKPFKPFTLPTVAPSKTTAGGVARGLSQFFVPYLGALKVLGVGKTFLGTLAKAEGAAVLTDQAVFDPFDKKLSDLVQEFPVLQNPATEYLQADEDDSEAEARFKLAVEGMGLGAFATTIIQSFRGLRSFKKGKTEQGIKEVDEAIKANPNVDEPRTASEVISDIKEKQTSPTGKAQTQQDAEFWAEPKSILEGTAKERAANLRLDKIFGDSIKSTQDIRAITLANAKTFPEIIEKARRGVLSDEAVRRLAEDLGMPVQSLIDLKIGTTANAEQILSAGHALSRSAMAFHNAAVIASRTGLKADLIRMKDAQNVNVAAQASFSGLVAESGRTQRALRQLRYLPGIDADELIDLAGGEKSLMDIANKVSTLDPHNRASVNNLANKLSKPTLMDKWLEFWINGLLSGPQTHAVNALSNELTSFWSIPEYYLAAGIGAVRRTPERVRFGEANQRLYGWFQGHKEGWALAKKAFITENPSDIFSKIELPRERAIKGKLGKAVRLPGRALVSSDEFFKSIGYRMELNAQAYRSAIKAGLKPRSREFAEFVTKIKNNIPDNKNQIKQVAKELGMDVREYKALKNEISLKAIDNARYLTFTKPLQGISRQVSQITKEAPITKMLMPFVRTPTNIVRFAAERTPLGFVMRETKNAKGAARDVQMAKMGLASGAGALMVSMAAQGKITGSGPTDPKLRKTWLGADWQPYSFVFEDDQGIKHYYSYKRIEPMGILFGLTSDFYELSGEIPEKDADEIAAGIVASISQNLTDKTFFKGLGDFFEAMGNPDRMFTTYLQNLGGTVVPAMLAQTARTIDPVLRDTNSLLNRVKSRIPGWSKTLEARRHLWGEPIVLSGGLGPDIISPIYTSKSKNDLVNEELVRLKYSPSLPQRTQSGTEIPDDLYWKFVEEAGKPAKDELDVLMALPVWKEFDSRPSEQKDQIRKTINKYRNQARLKLRVRMGEYLTKREKIKLIEELKIEGHSQESAEQWIRDQTDLWEAKMKRK